MVISFLILFQLISESLYMKNSPNYVRKIQTNSENLDVKQPKVKLRKHKHKDTMFKKHLNYESVDPLVEMETQTDKKRRQDDVDRSRKSRVHYNLLHDIFVDDKEGRFSAAKQLKTEFLPSNIHYIWCGARSFMFREYLSMMSVIRTIRPDRIFFHYEYEPIIDKNYYHLWLHDIKQDYPFLVMEKMTKSMTEFCFAAPEKKLSIILKLLNDEGGLYVSETTWFLDFDPDDKQLDLQISFKEGTLDGFVLLRAGTYSENGTIGMMLSREDLKTKETSCSEVRHLYNGQKASSCLTLPEEKYGAGFFPKHIWHLNNSFGEIARTIFYGDPAIRVPEPSYDDLVPNIGHMVWLKGREMDMLFYLGALSFLYVMNVDCLYIHGDKPPTGEYWEILKKNERVVRVNRPLITKVYQHDISSSVIMSDVMRVDIMNKYGGIYADRDAIWVRPLTREERSYDAVACYDWVDWARPFPELVNLGVFYGKKHAPFWQVFRETNRILHNKVPGFTGVQMPYKLMEKFPHLLKIDPRLAVICYNQKCHPIWVEDFHNGRKDHTNTNSIPDWRNDVHAFHWTSPNPPEYNNITTLINSKGMFAEIGKFVLEKAGLLTMT